MLQEDREQYDNCNASVTNGKVVKIGNCLVNLTGIRNYTERIQGLSTVIEDSNIIDYKNGVNYYFLSQFSHTILLYILYSNCHRNIPSTCMQLYLPHCLSAASVHLSGFADGTAGSVQQSPNSGGLCEEGLKMIISVGIMSSRISQGIYSL